MRRIDFLCSSDWNWEPWLVSESVPFFRQADHLRLRQVRRHAGLHREGGSRTWRQARHLARLRHHRERFEVVLHQLPHFTEKPPSVKVDIQSVSQMASCQLWWPRALALPNTFYKYWTPFWYLKWPSLFKLQQRLTRLYGWWGCDEIKTADLWGQICWLLTHQYHDSFYTCRHYQWCPLGGQCHFDF